MTRPPRNPARPRALAPSSLNKSGVLRLCASLVGLAMCLGCPGFGEREPQSVAGTGVLCVDVQAVFEANCNDCHSAPPTGGAPRYMRLDSLADVDGIEGAVTQANRSLIRAEGGTMPPVAFGRMPADDIETLRRWVAAGTPTSECEPAAQALHAEDVLDQADIGLDAPH